MRSSEVAAVTGVSVQALRYYERLGLLRAPGRLGSGYRSYGPDAVDVVRFIKCAQRLGFALRDIGDVLAVAEETEACGVARQVALSKVAQLDERINSLSAMRGRLADLVEACAQSSDAPCPPLALIRQSGEHRVPIEGEKKGDQMMADPAELACNLGALTPSQRKRHAALLAEVRDSVMEVAESEDGYQLKLRNDARAIAAASEWITLERECCPFLDFHLNVGRVVSLRLGGVPGVKAFLASEIGLG